MLTYQVMQPYGLRFAGKNYKQFDTFETDANLDSLLSSGEVDLFDAGTSPAPPEAKSPADYAGFYDGLLGLPEFATVRAAAALSLESNIAYTDIGVALNALMRGVTPAREAGFCNAQANLIAALPEEDRAAVSTALLNLAAQYNCKECPL